MFTQVKLRKKHLLIIFPFYLNKIDKKFNYQSINTFSDTCLLLN